MTLNYPGPYTLELEYLYSGITHTASFNVELTTIPVVGEPFSSIGVMLNSGPHPNLRLILDGFEPFYANLFSSATQFIQWSLWRNTPFSYERTFISSSDPLEPEGTSAGTNNAAHQITMSFRSTNGGIAKIVALEGDIGGNDQSKLLADGSSRTASLAQWVIGPTGCFIARDNGRLALPLKLSRGENERIFRARYR